ncbi:MAG TPA: CUAEP/CCAEP-tail radical SAM protein [Vicinamibacterales bacterium]
MKALLISTYDLGRQPFGLASPAAFLRRAGHQVTCVDTTRTPLTDDSVRDAGLVAFFLPMHTATRLALPLIDRVQAANPSAHVCAYGLYAPLNEAILRARGVATVLGPEFEPDLEELATKLDSVSEADLPLRGGVGESGVWLPARRVPFIQPDRSGLPPLSRYATLQVGDTRKIVGYTEATRGCKHRCRHCPIVPVYEGRFRAVPIEIVTADIRAEVAAGARHMTFGDPDFFNGPAHAIAIVETLAREFPGVSYDVTIKVEHLRRHAALLPRLRETGCAFVTSAVESIDDEVLAKLEKGHTRADFEVVARHCASIDLPLSPTFVAFTPWTTIESYRALLDAIERLDLIAAVSPIQYAIRLLIPQGSRMLELEDVRARVSHFDPASLTNIWRHEDPRVDALQTRIEQLVGQRLTAPRGEMFARVRAIADAAAGLSPQRVSPLLARAAVPYLNEPWYC